MTAEQIANRIREEHKKHPQKDWALIAAKKITPELNKPFKITAFNDDNLEGFGGYLAKSIKEGQGFVILNLEAHLTTSIEQDMSLKEIVVETLMHEVGHALEEWYDLEFNEDRIEAIIDSYREKYLSNE